jgi:hypothetical protein
MVVVVGRGWMASMPSANLVMVDVSGSMSRRAISRHWRNRRLSNDGTNASR